ncbi:adenosine deaminase-like protein isoform X1 [Canna indica]|uniref:Adenosine deaminase-like protein isoform X1 n=1 Tax=Canna indica TaxID=4628 RepID=A0AAQ3KHX2_9LILI|nr:adenosine deaminase-like protein isoform X1 [Canna indica]
MELMEWCRELPKIELHAHLNGSVRDSTLLELAKVLGEKGVIVFADVAHVIMKNGRSLPECFMLFDLFHILTTDHQTVTRITKEVIEDFAAENVVYLELRTTPKKNEAKGMTKRSYMEAVIDGIKAVDSVDVAFVTSDTSKLMTCSGSIPVNGTGSPIKRKKIYVRLLLSIDRRETTAAAMETVNLAMDLKDFGVVGIDLSGNPVIGEWETFLPALKHAKELGLPITLHCAEVPNKKEIQAMLDIHPQRIGHACFLEDEEWRKAKFLKIPVEICLTSNIRTERLSSLHNHHFADLYKAKHPLSLCTDDSGLFSTTLSNEYYLAASTFGLNKSEIFVLARSAIQYAFVDDEVKEELTKVFDDAEKRLIS